LQVTAAHVPVGVWIIAIALGFFGSDNICSFAALCFDFASHLVSFNDVFGRNVLDAQFLRSFLYRFGLADIAIDDVFSLPLFDIIV
jgi:hypothetical protein